MKRGDIFFVHKGYADTYGSEQQSGRPAIIVSNNRCNASSSVVEVVYLTTKQKKPLPTHVEIMAQAISTALCEQIHSVEVDRIGTFLKTCTKEEMDQVDAALKISLGLTDDCDKTSQPAVGTIPQPVAVQNDTERMEYEIKLAKVLAEKDVYKQLYNDLMLKMFN